MKHIPLIIIVVAFTALATLYSVVVPLGEGPDEPGHARYMFFLARAGRLPVQQADATKSDVPGEGHQPPLAYALMVPLAAWLPITDRQFDMPGNTRFTWASPPAAVPELNALAHGSREYMPWHGFVLAWHLARLVSVALGAATVVLTYLAARAFEQRLAISDWGLGGTNSPIANLQSPVALLAAALVALNPQFLFISALVTNDALLVMLSAAILWLAVRSRTMDNGRWTMAEVRASSIVYRLSSTPISYACVMGLVLGLALLTKQSAIILAPVAFLAVLEHSWSATGMTKAQTGDGATRQRLVILSSCHLVIFVGITLLVSGWWYARNLRLYGDLFGLAAFQAEFMTQAFDPTSAAAWVAALGQLHSSFWARFGWMNVLPPGWVIGFFTIVELLALVGLTAEGRRQKAVGGMQFTAYCRLLTARWPLVALPLLAFGWVVSFALTTGLVAWQGRLLFPALPALAILLAAGIENVQLKMKNGFVRIAHFQFSILNCTLLALALWLPFSVIRPAYPQHTLPEAVALERLGTPVYGRFGLANDPGAELLGWQLSGPTRPGDTPELTLIWHALGRQNRNWTVFVHLVDAQGEIVAEDNRPPQDNAFPMLQWVAGDWVEDRHPLALPANLAPGEYHIRIGLFYPRTDRRAGVYSKRGTLRGDFLDIGTLTVGS